MLVMSALPPLAPKMSGGLLSTCSDIILARPERQKGNGGKRWGLGDLAGPVVSPENIAAQ